MKNKSEIELVYQKDLRNLIDYRREENNERLWSIASGLITLSGMDRLHKGYHTMDKMVVDRILKRAGIDPAEIEMIIFQPDEELFQKRSNIYQSYNQKDYEMLEKRLKEYEQETKELHIVHCQFVIKMRAWKMIQKRENIDLICSMLKKAIIDTVYEFGTRPLKDLSLAPEELELMILLASCYRRKNELVRAMFLLEEVFDYSRKRKMPSSLRASYLPFACLELSKVYEEKRQYEYARYYALTGINILYCTDQLQYLVALQDQYLKVEAILGKLGKKRSFQKKKIDAIREERETILEIYKESNIDPYCLYSTEQYENCYLFHELIGAYRHIWKMDRKEFSSDICTMLSFTIIENGKTVPKRTFKKWMEKIGWPQTHYLMQLHGVSADSLKMFFRVERYIVEQRYKDAELLFQQLENVLEEKRLINSYPENRQTLLRIHTVLEKEFGKISLSQAKRQYEKALAMTVPNYNKIDLTKYPLRLQEMKILNNIASCLWMQGKKKESIKLWGELEQQYENRWLCKHVYYRSYESILLNYTSVLGSQGEYTKSTEKTYELVRHLLENGCMDRVGRCYYELVWNREQELIEQGEELKRDEFCRHKLKQAEVIMRIVKNKFYIEFLREHRERLYDSDSK